VGILFEPTSEKAEARSRRHAATLKNSSSKKETGELEKGLSAAAAAPFKGYSLSL
jgi:hypothetical protein